MVTSSLSRDVEDDAQEPVFTRRFMEQLESHRVIGGAASFYKAAAEDAVVPLVQCFPVSHDVAASVRFVGHH